MKRHTRLKGARFSTYQQAQTKTYFIHLISTEKTAIFFMKWQRRTTMKKSGGSETKLGLKRISEVCGSRVSQEPIAKNPESCGALSTLQFN